VIYDGVLGAAVLDTSNTTRQSSIFNEHTSELAVDNDVTTCSMTGFETDSWWVVDLGQSFKVLGVHVIGQYCGGRAYVTVELALCCCIDVCLCLVRPEPLFVVDKRIFEIEICTLYKPCSVACASRDTISQ